MLHIIRKWSNGGDRTSRSMTSRTDINTTQVEELFYVNLKLHRGCLRFRYDEVEMFVGEWLRKQEPDFEYD
jgi:hypothetical protein